MEAGGPHLERCFPKIITRFTEIEKWSLATYVLSTTALSLLEDGKMKLNIRT